jgi:hypothetical protein
MRQESAVSYQPSAISVRNQESQDGRQNDLRRVVNPDHADSWILNSDFYH